MKDLNLLYVFEALWRERSVTRAAEHLALTQAAVSSALKRLRQEYGDKLFTQIGRRMEPTPYAASIAHQMLGALAMIRKADNSGSRFDPETSQRLYTIRTRDIGEVVCFPRLVSLLATAAPNIRLRTVFKPIEETLNELASGQIDFALGFLPSLETAIHRRILLKQHYVCVMRAGHPIANEPLTLDLFRRQSHLLVEYSGSGHQILERALIGAGAKSQIKLRLPQYLSSPHFLMTSDMVWCAPEALANTLAGYYPLAIKPMPIRLPEFEIALYWHDRFHSDRANQWLRDFIVENLSVEPMPPLPVSA
ncbi:LysR family transcriptional regulator [Noviherbaspirillum humi]|nr:LysR family transcriptional regulator [Noviherbaspirillum humi]